MIDDCYGSLTAVFACVAGVSLPFLQAGSGARLSFLLGGTGVGSSFLPGGSGVGFSFLHGDSVVGFSFLLQGDSTGSVTKAPRTQIARRVRSVRAVHDPGRPVLHPPRSPGPRVAFAVSCFGSAGECLGVSPRVVRYDANVS